MRSADLLGGHGRMPDPVILYGIVDELIGIDHPPVVADRGMMMILIVIEGLRGCEGSA